MLSILFGMTPTCGNCEVIRSLDDAFQIMRLTQSCSFVILPHREVTWVFKRQLAKCLTMAFIGPPSLKMRGRFVALVSSVREQEVHLHGDNKCLSNLCYSVRCLMSGVYISWALFLYLLVMFTFSLQLIMFQNGWKPSPLELMMLRLL